jgi:branched-chain amino acid transport system ATP-binding protein/neutral amino acid transport system ATP-binding protein
LFETKEKDYQKKVEEILAQIDLREKQNELAINLSYGQRKLLEIGRVLAMDPQVFLLDEPFAGLFPEMVKKVVTIIQALKQRGKTIILIEHNMDLIRQLSDYVFVLDSGKLLAQGKPNEVLAKPEVIEAYLGE